MDSPDLLTISVSHIQEVVANRADVFVSIKGASLVQGNIALKKAREVSQLVEALRALGLPEEAIELQGASVDVGAGLLTKASSANYQLRIRWPTIESLPDLLGAIASQKQATLDSITWRYPDDPQEMDRWTEQNIQRANEKARKMAAALGVRILGVHKVEESLSEGAMPTRMPMMAPQSKASGTRSASFSREDFGMEIVHRKTVHVQLTVAYRLS
ncbi:MAG: SIMPL domain-containing protein, partial [Oscillochloris sp.]|nr:SIMPL domain-containing protein [Oscillochloris sp.]